MATVDDLDAFAGKATKAHDAKVAAPVRKTTNRGGNSTRATALVSMTTEEKERFTEAAKGYGQSLSAFFRFAANEFIINHKQ